MLFSTKKKWLGTFLLASFFFNLNCFAENTIPSHIFTRDNAPATTILVDKKTKAAFIIDFDDNRPKLTKEYQGLLFGGKEGDKKTEGDKRTPEGIYHVTSFIPDEKLDARYGTGAFPINYPNALDKIEGRNGSGIWLHGKDESDLSKVATRGCVAFNNQQIISLKETLQPKTKVIITKEVEFVDEAEYEKQRQNYFKLLDSYIAAWRNGDVDQLEKILHPNFISDARLNKKQWINKKRLLNKLYPERDITTKYAVALKENENLISFNFRQLYCAKNIISHGEKNLFFKRDEGKLKLIAESFSRIDVEPMIDGSINDFIDTWSQSWQNEELDIYLNLYINEYKDNKGRNLDEWKTYKTKLFASRSGQKIELSDLKINKQAGNRYKVSFKQKYLSDQYSDYGWKTLILKGCPGSFQISQESWSKI